METKEIKFYSDPQFCGSEYYRKIGFLLLATDGAQHIFEKLNCFWFADIIDSYIPALKKINDWFFVAKLIKAEDNSALFTIDDGNGNILITQDIPLTDIEYNLKMYVSITEFGYMVMLPSEY
jgi:hypothetical protein